MSTHHRIDYVELPARDLDNTKQFFRDVFGWGFTDFGPDYTAFEDAGLMGGFFRDSQASRTDRGAALVVLYSRDLDQTQAQVEAAGGRISKAIFSFPGGRRFQFFEPSGNELAVWSDQGMDESADQ
ncbi:VOC family protein [Motiliproteus coralliicola]|uniref:VOC family protein n=1 Tax=Motiliproteus coralliicola TaxID=2283196 RepID=A0A369WJU6_9GAMM|nr:VOC family protein [Motiliproteus coralliicola]RDE19725.1 VOC family protein [Motiliproteus coralliicola]